MKMMVIDISSTYMPGYLVSTSQLLPHLILTVHEVWVPLFLSILQMRLPSSERLSSLPTVTQQISVNVGLQINSVSIVLAFLLH